MEHEQNTPLLQEQLEAYLARAPRALRLRFPRELEQHYEQEQKHIKAHEAITIGLVANVLFVSFLLGDYALDPANLWRSIVLRLGIFTPCSLTCIAIAWRWRSRRVRESAKGFAVAAAGWCTLAVAVDRSGVISMLSQTGFLLTIVFGLLILRLAFSYALWTTSILLLQEGAFLRSEAFLRPAEKLCCIFLVGTCAILSLITNRSQEVSERQAYLLLLREELRGRKLTQLNQSLADLSHLDPLTKLSNRRHFDQQLEHIWTEAAREATPVSLLLLDLDRFKLLNDTFGHLFGDHVLMELAGMLQANVRGREDLVARFGGEEFVVVLPRAAEARALQVAESIRSTLAARLWHPVEGEAALQITVSCGVAEVQPGESISRAQLIDAADQALYRAKRGGRNRVCASSEREPAPGRNPGTGESIDPRLHSPEGG